MALKIYNVDVLTIYIGDDRADEDAFKVIGIEQMNMKILL